MTKKPSAANLTSLAQTEAKNTTSGLSCSAKGESMPRAHIAVDNANTCMLPLCPIVSAGHRVRKYAITTPGSAKTLTNISSYAGFMLFSCMKNFGKTYVNPKTEKSFVKWQKNRKSTIDLYLFELINRNNVFQEKRFLAFTTVSSPSSPAASLLGNGFVPELIHHCACGELEPDALPYPICCFWCSAFSHLKSASFSSISTLLSHSLPQLFHATIRRSVFSSCPYLPFHSK